MKGQPVARSEGVERLFLGRSGVKHDFYGHEHCMLSPVLCLWDGVIVTDMGLSMTLTMGLRGDHKANPSFIFIGLLNLTVLCLLLWPGNCTST